MNKPLFTRERCWLCIVYVAIAAYVYAMNSFMPFYHDDIWYSYRYVEEDELTPLRHVSDVFETQYWHYLTQNGRAVVHVLLQLILGFLPEWMFDLLNTLMFVLLLFLLARTVSRGMRLTATILAAAALLWLLPAPEYLFYWAAGSLNYLWTSVAVLLFVALWNDARLGGGFARRHRILCVALSFPAGWSHEALALPVCAAVVLWMVSHRRAIGRNVLTVMTLAYVLGLLALVLAPAMHARTEVLFTGDEWGERIGWLTTGLRKLRATPLLYLAWLPALFTQGGRSLWRRYFCRYGFWIIVHVVSLLFTLYVGTASTTERTYYGLEFFSALLLLAWVMLLLRRASRRMVQVATIAPACLLLLWACAVVPAAHRAGDRHRALFADYPSSPDGVLYLPRDTVNPLCRRWVMDLRHHYFIEWEANWKRFLIPLAMQRDTVMHMPEPPFRRDSCGVYELYKRYVCVWPAELRDVVEHPQRFFVEEHSIPGDNPFYTAGGSDFMVALLDSVPVQARYCWRYELVSWHDPAYSLAGVLRRMFMPASYPDSEPVLYPDTVILPGGVRCMVVVLPRYRRLKSVERVCE